MFERRENIRLAAGGGGIAEQFSNENCPAGGEVRDSLTLAAGGGGIAEQFSNENCPAGSQIPRVRSG